jgi:NAD(P)-dependent dehydrogenase (short-subunit alcohol dehydrogenase family)
MADMHGKTVLITGANQGLGKASAVALGKMGANLVLVCRNADKAHAAIADIEKAGAKDVDLIVGDLASQAEVRRIAAEFLKRHDRLDVLMNNAGVLVPTRRTTPDGIEETFAINHLAYFLLTSLLREILQASQPSRVINVSSEAHRGAKMHWDDLQFEKGDYRSFTAYSQSKLCNILFTRELARRLAGTQVTANCNHPGFVATGFGRTYGGYMSVVMRFLRPFMINLDRGMKTQVWLASAPELAGVSGKYFEKCAERTPNQEAQDDARARKLWEISETLTATRNNAQVL